MVGPQELLPIPIVQPETVVRWHRAGFWLFWTHYSRGTAGRPRAPVEVRPLIQQISRENPLWDAPRAHGKLLRPGSNVSQSTVAKDRVRGRKPLSQRWLTFLRNHADGIAATDLFFVPTISS